MLWDSPLGFHDNPRLSSFDGVSFGSVGLVASEADSLRHKQLLKLLVLDRSELAHNGADLLRSLSCKLVNGETKHFELVYLCERAHDLVDCHSKFKLKKKQNC